MNKNTFTVSGLTVGYNKKPLISDISFTLEPGTVLTLIGPNGAGKSTILKSITRHLSAISGTVTIGNDDLLNMSGGEAAKRLSVVLTERLTPELMTCRDVVATGRYPYTGRFGMLDARDNEIVDRCIELVHARDIAHRDFNRISDGQRQRILLARALCQEPEVIVLDEPTSFLDIRHKAELLNILTSMARAEGITVIMSLHEIDLAAKVSDIVVCVKGDRIMCAGTPEEVFTTERIKELYSLEAGTYDVMYGSMELKKTEGEPKVFVLSGAGFGIPFFRALQRKRIPFAAGILQKSDIDYPVAEALAGRVFACGAYEMPNEELIDEALKALAGCDMLLDSGVPCAAGNAYNQRLTEFAKEHGIPVKKEL